MAKREHEPITRLHVNLYTSDLEMLRQLYGEAAPGGRNIGMAKAIRIFVRAQLNKIRERQAEAAGPLPKIELSAEDLADGVD